MSGRADSIEDLLRVDDTRLRRAALKLTHMGEQTGPVLTVVIQSCFYLPSIRTFRALATGSSYGNDDLPVIANFSVGVEQLRRLFAAVASVRADGAVAAAPALSVTALVDTPEGLEGAERLFPPAAAAQVHAALAAALDAGNAVGHEVLKRQRATYGE